MKRVKNRYIWILSVICVIAVIYLASNPSVLTDIYNKVGLSSSVASGKLNIYFIDTGQSDSALMTDGTYSVLIDAGDIDDGNNIASFIKSKGIDKLDTVIISHPHADHIGGMPEILKQIEVKQFYIPDIPDSLMPTTDCFEKTLELLEINKVETKIAEKGVAFTVGDMNFKVISPAKEYDELNNISAVVRMTYGKSSFLFCGDAEKEVENDILESGEYISSDLIKVGHHGSGTSSIKKFVKAVSPQYAIFCVEEDNSYGHPSAAVVERYEDIGAEIYRTDTHGTITVICDGENIEITTEKSA